MMHSSNIHSTSMYVKGFLTQDEILYLFKIPSASKIANPNHFRYFELCINQPDRSPDAQILPLVLSPILQIKDSASARRSCFSESSWKYSLARPPRPRLRPSDRFFFSIMTDLFDSWKETLLVVKPETVIRWHRQSFRLFWKWKSRSEAGRPKIPQAQIDLIKQMANDNPLWGAPRIHGEMLKLGFDISEATVQRYMPKKAPKNNQATLENVLEEPLRANRLC